MEGFIIENQYWYGEVLDLKKPYLAEIRLSPATGLPVMGSNCPILNDENEVVSIFVMTINLNSFSKMIVENRNDTSQETMIIDESGLVISSEDEEMIGVYSIAENKPELFEKVQSGEEGVISYKWEDQSYLAHIEKSEYGVYVIQSVLEDTYQKPIMTSVFVSCFIVLVILGWLFF
jgi:hypothetical protein